MARAIGREQGAMDQATAYSLALELLRALTQYGHSTSFVSDWPSAAELHTSLRDTLAHITEASPLPTEESGVRAVMEASHVPPVIADRMIGALFPPPADI
jgi:hypothetical protein